MWTVYLKEQSLLTNALVYKLSKQIVVHVTYINFNTLNSFQYK